MSEQSGIKSEISQEAYTPLQVGRATKIILNKLEDLGDVKISEGVKRKTIRHETAHALGRDQNTVKNYLIKGQFDGFDKNGTPTSFNIGMETITKKADRVKLEASAIKSAVAPLGDKRIKQELSSADKNRIKKGFLRILGLSRFIK